MEFLRKYIRLKRQKNKEKKNILVEEKFYTKNYFKNRKFVIGDYTYGKPNVLYENPDANLIIGRYCSISSNVTIFLGGNHRHDWITTYPFNKIPTLEFVPFHQLAGHPATNGDVIIGNDVWIGMNVTILSGVAIADGAVIAAGSVVSKNIGAYEIWGGNPCRFIKKRFTDEQINKLLQIQWWNWDPEKVKKNIETFMSDNFDQL